MKKWKNTCLLFLAATVTCCSTVYAASDYIIADSNSRYLTYEDVGSLSLQQVNYAKNEIFARHGRKFVSVSKRINPYSVCYFINDQIVNGLDFKCVLVGHSPYTFYGNN